MFVLNLTFKALLDFLVKLLYVSEKRLTSISPFSFDSSRICLKRCSATGSLAGMPRTKLTETFGTFAHVRRIPSRCSECEIAVLTKSKS